MKLYFMTKKIINREMLWILLIYNIRFYPMLIITNYNNEYEKLLKKLKII